MKQKKVFYGWFVVLACFISSFVLLGLGNSPNGLYVTPITESLGFTRGAYSITHSLRSVTSVILNLSFGFLVGIFGMHKMMSIGMLFAAGAMFLFSIAAQLPLFYVGGILLGAAFSFASTAVISSLINNWFAEHRGTILGLIFAGSGVGGFLFNMLVGNWIADMGWRQSYLISGMIMLCAMVPILLLVRNHPAAKGLVAYGLENSKEKTTKTAYWQGLSAKEAFHQPYFYLTVLLIFLIGLITNPVVLSAPAHLTDSGFDVHFAAGISGMVYLSLAFAKLSIGWIYDKWNLHTSMLICIITYLAAILFLAFAKTEWMAIAYALLLGFSLPLETLIITFLATDLFGLKGYSTIVGIFLATLAAGVACGAPLLNFSYDLTGSYRFMLLCYAAIAVVIFMVFRIAQKASLRYRAQEKTE